jgi:hypothetical protein
LLLVGEPSTGKSDTVNKVTDFSEGVKVIHTLTAHALSSGYRENGKKAASLLDSVDGKCLVMPDLAAFFEQHEATVKKIIGDLTAAYDGTFHKATGTSAVLQHKAHFGLLGCSTPAHLRRYERYFTQIGSRFLFYRLAPPTAKDRAAMRQALGDPQRETLKQQLTDLVTAQLRRLRQTLSIRGAASFKPEDPATDDWLWNAAELLAVCRAAGIASGEPQVEGSGRVFQQQRSLGRSLAWVRGDESVSKDDTRILWRIITGTMSSDAREVFNELLKHPGGATVAAVRGNVEASEDAVRAILRLMADRGICNLTQQQGRGGADAYTLAPAYQQLPI